MTKIKVIPEWFNHALMSKSICDKINASDQRYHFDTKFNIMIMGLLTSQNPEDDRKNLLNTLKWSIETFEGNKNVGIVLKTSLGKSTEFDNDLCKNVVKELISRFRKSEFPKVHLIHGNMKSEEIAALYSSSKIKVFATATRGEGYGLPIIDAAASGTPIVATGWSGHFEFLNRELVFDVDYELKQISKSRVDNAIFLEGFRWAEPDRQSFCNSLRTVYEDYATAKSKANKLKKDILKNYNKTIIKKSYDEIMDVLK